MTSEKDPSTRYTSRYLAAGSFTLGVAVIYVARVFLVPWSPACFLMPLTLMALVYGGVAILIGLTLKANRARPRLWKHLGVLLAIVLALYLLTVGRCSFFGLLDLQLRLGVARTGGQDRLRAWAMDLLEKSHDHTEDGGDEWRVPPEYWSDQVRRLHPGPVRVEVIFEGDRKGVRLLFGSGFVHWSLVVGPPGAHPHPRLRLGANRWIPWADGIFFWISP